MKVKQSEQFNQKALDNTKAQMRKGVLELCILSIIESRREAYPSDIIQELKNANLIVVEGTLYPLLSRMKKAGWLHYNWRESEMGPPRKYYHLTEHGKAFRSSLLETWDRLLLAVQSTVQSPPTAVHGPGDPPG